MDILEELKPIVMMVISLLGKGGASIFYKLAIADGMKVSIMMFYRAIFATAFVAPLALIIDRNKRPKLTWLIALQVFLSALFGMALSNNLYAESLQLTSATYASAMVNLVPAVTLILSVIFRLESVDIRTSAGKAKLLGTLVSISGAMILTFYKGMKIKIWSTNLDLLHHKGADGVAEPKNQALGAILALRCSLSYSIWIIVQTKIGRNYPFYSSTALMCFTGTILVGVYALCTEKKNWSSWKLGWDIRLLSSVVAGIFGTGLAGVITAWCSTIRGPLFVSSFNPLIPIPVVIVASLCLDEMLHLGSIIGSFFIITGLYVVLWGKSKARKLAKASESEGTRDLQETTSNNLHSPRP